jgi:hypothetical protein
MGEAIALPVHCQVPTIHFTFSISGAGFIDMPAPPGADMAAEAGFSAGFFAAWADAAEA